MCICHLIFLEKYGNTKSTTVVMERICWYKSDLINIQVIFCNSWVTTGKPPPKFLYNLMSGHQELDFSLALASFPGLWLADMMSAYLRNSIMSPINCSPLRVSQTPWRRMCKVQPALPAVTALTWQLKSLWLKYLLSNSNIHPQRLNQSGKNIKRKIFFLVCVCTAYIGIYYIHIHGV